MRSEELAADQVNKVIRSNYNDAGGFAGPRGLWISYPEPLFYRRVEGEGEAIDTH